METLYISVLPEATGNKIRCLMRENGYTVSDIKDAMGFENPQAVYKWLNGKSLPTVDNLVILSHVLHVSIEEILVVSGEDLAVYIGIFNHKFNDAELHPIYNLIMTYRPAGQHMNVTINYPISSC